MRRRICIEQRASDSAKETQTKKGVSRWFMFSDSLKKSREVGRLDLGGAAKAHLDRNCMWEEDYILESQSCFSFGVTIPLTVVLSHISRCSWAI